MLGEEAVRYQKQSPKEASCPIITQLLQRRERVSLVVLLDYLTTCLITEPSVITPFVLCGLIVYRFFDVDNLQCAGSKGGFQGRGSEEEEIVL